MSLSDDRYEKITTELSRLSSLLIEYTTENRANHKHISAMLEKHDHVLEGNGKPGLKAAVAELVTTEKNRKWHLKAVYTALVAGFADRYFNFIK